MGLKITTTGIVKRVFYNSDDLDHFCDQSGILSFQRLQLLYLGQHASMKRLQFTGLSLSVFWYRCPIPKKKIANI